MRDKDNFKSVYSGSKCIVLDTSFLVEMFSKPGLLDEFREAFPEARLVIPKSVYRELLRLSEGGGRSRGYARLALRFIGDAGVEVVDRYDSKADIDVLDLAEESGCAVATCDSSVMRRCRERGIRLIFLWRGVLTID